MTGRAEHNASATLRPAGLLLPKGRTDDPPALRLLVLGGSSEASALARALADRSDVAPLLSFAGRTEALAPPPIPFRVGGFGGVVGLAAFLCDEGIDAAVDATHPFAARISANAVAACRLAGVPLAVFARPAWLSAQGDDWHCVPDIPAAVGYLEGWGRRPDGARSSGFRVFLTTGRLDLARFRAAPQHHYLIRTIDPPDPAALPPLATVLLARPPFTLEGETALMRDHGVTRLVTKNSGGAASAAKLAAARDLGIPVLMVDRPAASGARELHGLDAVLTWIAAQRPRSRAGIAP